MFALYDVLAARGDLLQKLSEGSGESVKSVVKTLVIGAVRTHIHILCIGVCVHVCGCVCVGGFERAESREQRAESREQRAESREQRAESREDSALTQTVRPIDRLRCGNSLSPSF